MNKPQTAATKITQMEKGKEYVCVKCGRRCAVITQGCYNMGRGYTWNVKLNSWVLGISPCSSTGWPMHNVPPPKFYEKCELREVGQICVRMKEVDVDG